MQARILDEIIDNFKGNWPRSISADTAKVYLSQAQQQSSAAYTNLLSDSMRRMTSKRSKEQTGQTILYAIFYNEKIYFVDMAGIVARFVKDPIDWVKNFERRNLDVDKVLYTHLGDNIFLKPMMKSISQLIEEIQTVRQISELERKRRDNKHRTNIKKNKQDGKKRTDRILAKILMAVAELRTKPQGITSRTWDKFKELQEGAKNSYVNNRNDWYRSLHITDKFIVDEVLEAI